MDEHEGMGGSYSYDPITKKRTLLERTKEATPEDAATAETAAPEKPAQTPAASAGKGKE